MPSHPSHRQQRNLKAAIESRLTSDWQLGGGDINAEIRAHLSLVRNRARYQAKNNNYVKRYLRMVQNHVVGPNGFTLQVQGRLANGKMDARNNNRLETLIWDWSRRGVCELGGRLSFAALQRLAAQTVARDGEALLRLWDIQPSSKNPFGLSLELLDPARLDHTLHLDLRNGNRVRMGIEINNAGRPLAYWLLTNLTGDSIFQVQQKRHERVPATDLLHLYYPEDPEQLRGLTWLSAGMVKLHQLDGYSDAALVAARVGASKMGFFQSADPGMGSHAIADEQDGDEFMTSAEPGEFGVLPKGWTFNSFNPDYPSVAYDPFTKALLRETSSGMNVSYHALTGDLTSVNFSSIRSGSLEEREGWMTLQSWFTDSLLEPIYLRLLEHAALHGLVNQQDASLTLSRYSQHAWLPRRWQWVDPLKDITANITAIEAGLKSPQQVAAEQGMDIEDVLDQIAAFRDLLSARGLSLGPTAPTTQKKDVNDAED